MQKSVLVKISILFLVVLVASCTTVGNKRIANETEASVDAFMVKGVTTKKDVKNKFGSPDKNNFMADGSEQWEYHYQKTKNGIRNGLIGAATMGLANKYQYTSKDLVILFSPDNVVKSYRMSESVDGEINQGLFGN